MPFDVVQLDGIQNGVQLYDASGNVIVVQDGQALPSPKNGFFILGSDGTNARLVKTAADGTVAVSVAAIPPGTATETTLAAIKAKTDNIDVALSTRTKPADTQTIAGSVTANFSDVSSSGSIIALDSGTSSLPGSNGQTFYFGTPTTNSAAVFAVNSDGVVAIEASLLGSGGTMVVEVTMDGGTFWLRPNVLQIATQSYSNGFATPFIAMVNVTGMTHVRVRSTVSWSGSATVTFRASQNTRMVDLGDALPGGANTIGSINNILGTVSLPTGAATALNQTALGNQTTKVNDGTNTITVKPASTAPVAGDTALVAALHPSSFLPPAAPVIGTSALGALNAVSSITTAGFSSVGMQLAAGTLIGTLIPEVTFDGGTTWVSTYFSDPGTGALSGNLIFASANTAQAKVVIIPGGAGNVRVRVSAYTSGTANATLRATSIINPVPLTQGTAGVPPPPNIVQVGGSDGTNLRTLTTDSSGRQLVVGAAADGTAIAGNPVLVGGSDGTNAQSFLTDSSGQVRTIGPVRNRVAIIFQSTATATADTLLSLVKSTNGTAVAGATTIPVAAGKILHIISMTFSVRSNAALAAAFATFTLRINPAGAAVIGSQSELRVDLGNTAAAVGGSDRVTISFPEGFELSGTQQLAISVQAQATTNILSVTLNGYEF